jgi:hypothetical protein
MPGCLAGGVWSNAAAVLGHHPLVKTNSNSRVPIASGARHVHLPPVLYVSLPVEVS